MKKIFSLFLLLSVMLTGCGIANRNDVMNLLAAPRLSRRESRIITAINDYLGAEIVLKYPKTGSNISPVQFVDLNEDGTEEAVVLYDHPASGLYVRMAIMTQAGEEWQVSYDTEGYGSEVYSIAFENITKTIGPEIAVSYTFADSSEKILSVYFMENGRFKQEQNLTCQDYAIYDITGDGVKDIILAGINADNHRTQLKIISTRYNPGYLTTLAVKQISARNANVTNIDFTRSQLSETENIIIDYTDTYHRVYTEAFRFENNTIHPTLAQDVVQKYWYADYDLNSRDIDGDGYFETPTIIDDGSGTQSNLKQMEWTCFIMQEPVRKYYGVCEADSGVFFPLPEEWQNTITLAGNREDKSWQVQQAGTEEVLVNFHMVTGADTETPQEGEIIVGKGTVQVRITFAESVTGDQRGYIANGLTDIRQ